MRREACPHSSAPGEDGRRRCAALTPVGSGAARPDRAVARASPPSGARGRGREGTSRRGARGAPADAPRRRRRLAAAGSAHGLHPRRAQAQVSLKMGSARAGDSVRRRATGLRPAGARLAREAERCTPSPVPHAARREGRARHPPDLQPPLPSPRGQGDLTGKKKKRAPRGPRRRRRRRTLSLATRLPQPSQLTSLPELPQFLRLRPWLRRLTTMAGGAAGVASARCVARAPPAPRRSRDATRAHFILFNIYLLIEDAFVLPTHIARLFPILFSFLGFGFFYQYPRRGGWRRRGRGRVPPPLFDGDLACIGVLMANPP